METSIGESKPWWFGGNPLNVENFNLFVKMPCPMNYGELNIKYKI